MSVMTASEARATLPDLLTRVEGGEEITITRHGRPVAVLVAPGVYRVRRAAAAFAAAQRLHEMLEAAATSGAPTRGISVEYAEELIAQIRADRDADYREMEETDQWTRSTRTP